MAEYNTGTNKSSSSTSSSSGSYRPSSLSSGSSTVSSSPSPDIRNMSASLKDAYSTVQKKAQDAISSSEEFVRARPLRTVLGAAAVGFLAAMIARRKH